jgi:uncharacterized protein YacL
MTNHQTKGHIRNILSVVTGVVAGTIAFILLALFFFSIGMLMWTDGGSKEEIARTEFNIVISILLILIIGSLLSGIITSIISSRNDIKLSIITGIILVIITILLANFGFSFYGLFEIIIACLLLPLTIVGGLIGNKIKKRIQTFK